MKRWRNYEHDEGRFRERSPTCDEKCWMITFVSRWLCKQSLGELIVLHLLFPRSSCSSEWRNDLRGKKILPTLLFQRNLCCEPVSNLLKVLNIQLMSSRNLQGTVKYQFFFVKFDPLLRLAFEVGAYLVIGKRGPRRRLQCLWLISPTKCCSE